MTKEICVRCLDRDRLGSRGTPKARKPDRESRPGLNLMRVEDVAKSAAQRFARGRSKDHVRNLPPGAAESCYGSIITRYRASSLL